MWNGNSGTFTAKAIKNPTNNQGAASVKPSIFPVRAKFWIVVKSKLPVFAYSHRIAASMKAEAIIVYRKNFTAAYTRRPWPNMPISNAMGISVASQKK